MFIIWEKLIFMTFQMMQEVDQWVSDDFKKYGQTFALRSSTKLWLNDARGRSIGE